MTAIRIPDVLAQAGLSDIGNFDEKRFGEELLPASIAAFTDGDLAVVHPTFTGELAELYGESHFSQGRVTRALAEAAIANGPDPSPLYDYQGFLVPYFSNDPTGQFQGGQVKSAIKIYPEAITVDGNPIALRNAPRLVVDYGACLTGRSYQTDQWAFAQQGKQPFVYAPLARMHFTNRVLMDNYDKVVGQEGASRAFVENRLYIGREDGIAGGTNEIIAAQQTHGASAEVADIVLCADTQHTSAAELRRGVINAHTLLRQGGMLVVRALARPTESEVGTQQVAEWAYEAGFSERGAAFYDGSISNLGSLIMSGHFGQNTIQTVVLAKH